MAHAAMIVAVAAVVTAALRFAPFLLFSGDRETPPVVVYLGKVLPSAIMGMLVVYCLRGISFSSTVGYLPAVLASLSVVLLHIRKRSSLLSILGGTVIYMLLLRLL